MAARTSTRAPAVIAAPVAVPKIETPLVTVEAPKEPALLEGWTMLAAATQDVLSRYGAVIATLPKGAALPRTYELVDAVTAIDPGDYRAILPLIEKMSMQGMEPLQIAQRLGMTRVEFQEALVFLPEWRQAVIGGRARGIEQVAAKAFENAAAGDVASASMYLKSKGGWRPESVNAKPLFLVNIGSQPASVSLQPIEDMIARQAALLDGVEWEELG